MTKNKKLSKTESDRLFIEKIKTLQIGVSFSLSDKVQEQRRKFADDLEQPHIYDKTKRKLVLNPRFVHLYPDKVRYYETPQSIRKQGYSKLADYTEKLNKASDKIRNLPATEYSGHEAKAIHKIIK